MLMVIERGRSSKQVCRWTTRGFFNTRGLDQWSWSTGPAWGCQYLTWLWAFLLNEEGAVHRWVRHVQQDDIGQQVASEGWLIGRAAVVHIWWAPIAYLQKVQSLLQLLVKTDSEETSCARTVGNHTSTFSQNISIQSHRVDGNRLAKNTFGPEWPVLWWEFEPQMQM